MFSIQKKCSTAVILFALSSPAHAAQPTLYAPICQSSASDSDGDGFGWENSTQCVITNATDVKGARPVCRLGTSDSDGNGWGYQSGVSCLVVKTNAGISSAAPPVTGSRASAPQVSGSASFVVRNGRQRPVCQSASSDPDGDGWGEENSVSCVVSGSGNTSVISTNTPQATDNSFVIRNGRRRPVCEFAGSDTDGDGWGTENSTSCVVTANSDTAAANDPVDSPVRNLQGQRIPTAPLVDANNRVICGSTLSDADGDGFGYENGSSCVVTSLSRPYPICLSIHSDLDDDGFGFEGRQSCITVPGVSADRDNLLLGTPLCDSWNEIAYGNYRIENNTWNARVMDNSNWSQCIELNMVGSRPVASWTFDWLDESEGQVGAVKSYPQVYYGRKTQRNVSGTFEELGLPERVYNLPEFKVDYRWKAIGVAEYNVALESFFHTDCEAGHANKEYEMMVWIGVPAEKRPGVLVGNATIDGRRWQVYASQYLTWGYVAFLAEQDTTRGTLNWNRFVEWTRDNSRAYGLGELRASDCMGAIEIGTETFWGKGEFTLEQFNVRIE